MSSSSQQIEPKKKKIHLSSIRQPHCSFPHLLKLLLHFTLQKPNWFFFSSIQADQVLEKPSIFCPTKFGASEKHLHTNKMILSSYTHENTDLI